MKSPVLWIVSLFIFACTPKVAENVPVVNETPKVQDNPVTANPDCRTFADLGGYDREQAETAYILYRDQIKAGRYTEAYKYWKTAFFLAPGANGRIKYQFSDGAAIYKHFFDNTNDTLLRRSYVDTIMTLYDKQISCFGDTAHVNGLKAFDLYYYFSDYADEDKIYQLFKSNFDKKGTSADYFVINPFTKLLYDRVLEEKISLQEGRYYADLIYRTVEKGLKECKGSGCDTWNIINDYAPVRLESLEGVDDFYDCAYYTRKYYALFEANRDSCEIVNLAYSRMLRGDCPETHPQLAEVKKVKDGKCYVPPPAASCLKLAYEAYGQGKYKAAVGHFEKCVEDAKDNESKAKYLITIAKIYYGDLRDFPKARKYALDAAALKPNWGEPYMLIGKLYASSGPLCGPGTGWDSQVVTWPAIDKFEYARRIDPSVSAEANKLIAQYSRYMPKKEDLHFRILKAGDPFRVGCWIQENTTIRTSD